MYITKIVASITTTGNVDSTQFSAVGTGLIHSIEYVPGTAESSGTVSVYPEASTQIPMLSSITLSTDKWTYYPRAVAHNSTGATTSWDGDTGARKQTVPYALAQDRVRFIMGGMSTALGTATFNVYVEGA